MAKKGNIVKKSKRNLNLVLIVVLAIGWLCAVNALFNNEDEKEQEKLIRQAQVYLEDKLYVRAIKNYKTAIKDYQTEKNLELETELLALYKEAEMSEEYYQLIKTRIGKKTATEEEYIELAKMYLEENSVTRVLNVLDDGIEKYENTDMIQMREQVVYRHKVRTIEWPEITQFGDNGYIPVSTGEKWGYTKITGEIAIDFMYEEATAFCNGYAVVKLDGVYTLIDEDGNRNAVDKNNLERVTAISPIALVGEKGGTYQIYSRTFHPMSDETFDCVYANDNGTFFVQKGGKWALLDEELKQITDYIFTDVAINSKGKVFDGDYAVVKDEAGYFLITPDGKARYETRFANAKGFEGGLYAVANENGEWGFANQNAEMIVDFQYTDALSFSSNLAAVESAGKWGYINRYNTMMIEPSYTSALPFVKENALVRDKDGTYKVLILKYYDYSK